MTSAGYIRFVWKKYIDFAEKILKAIPPDAEDETAERCGISRAYYGAFNVARNYLLKKNQTIDVEGKGSHERVIRVFEDFGKSNRLFSCIALELRNLKALRISADYNDKFFSNSIIDRNKILKHESELALLRARKIVSWIDAIEGKDVE